MNTQLIQDILHELLDTHAAEEFDLPDFSVTTYEDAGMLTEDKGVVIDIQGAGKFQITIVKA